jgi:predicted lipid-binding transport protein (Tim44 family)
MKRFFSKFLALVLVAASTFSMIAVSFDAEARRFGGGVNTGRQSTNVMQQRQATQAPAAAATPAAGAAAAGARTGGSRWLGPLAGIAAGLGIAALLSHLGLGGALADLLVIALIAGVAIFGISFIMRALRGGMKPAVQGAAGNTMRRESAQPAFEPRSGLMGSSAPAAAAPQMGDWFIPADFDQQTFIEEAKKQFVGVQNAWDKADFDGLRERLTDEFYAQYAPQLAQRQGLNKTEIVILNADLMGIEKVAGGYLASVRFSGMIREDDNPDAVSFEEAWNLYKPTGQGWLLAGVQQMPGSVS